MTDFAKPLALSLFIGLAALTAHSIAFAQEAPAPATEAAPAGDAPSVDGLSLGAEVGADGQAAPAVGQSYTRETFEQWELRCVKTADGADPCQLYQLLKDAQGNAVSEISMFPLQSDGPAAAGATIVAPLETLLSEALVLGIDTATPKVYPFTWCSEIGCIARVGFTAEEVEQFKKGAKATVTIVPVVAPDQKVQVDISLKGFTAAYDAVTAAIAALPVAPAAPAN